jgi:hypothetical protein
MTCGHRCCRIAGNAYHAHLIPPDRCAPCADALGEIVNLGDIIVAVADAGDGAEPEMA